MEIPSGSLFSGVSEITPHRMISMDTNGQISNLLLLKSIELETSLSTIAIQTMWGKPVLYPLMKILLLLVLAMKKVPQLFQDLFIRTNANDKRIVSVV